MPMLHTPIRAPEFTGGEWLNSPPLTMSDLRGKVILINFWDYTCVSCLRMLPYLVEWDHRYRDHGLVVVGIHTPEFDFGRQEDYVRQAVEQYGIDFPVLLDNTFGNWRRWLNRYWPSTYLVDGEGKLRYFHYGEGSYQETERVAQQLLLRMNPAEKLPPLVAPLRPTDMPGAVCYQPTPQIYFGYRRGQLGNRELPHPGLVEAYIDPGEHHLDAAYLDGHWMNATQAEVLAGQQGSIILRYRAKEVCLVAAPPPHGTGRIEVTQDQASLSSINQGLDVQIAGGISFLEIDTPRLYQVVNNPEFGIHDLRFVTRSPGIAVYSLMFTTVCVAESPSAQAA